eukprot:GHVQ01022299.1.p1 GENE.GHVQ01022299.1~~GHVQ01022299.1.p1  ORF type:complete len:1579 (+),score=350.90 GHVQ01022299.1:471-5207(+)
MPLEPTQIIKIEGNNKWEVPCRLSFQKKIGSGAYGCVVSFYDNVNKQSVAVKKIGNAFKDFIDAKRILREIKILRHLRHDNIISILDIFSPPSVDFNDVYLVSELMETDLAKVIYSKQHLLDDHVQYFVYQILRGLLYLHSGNVLHRDLKPSNVLVNLNCDLKICDFGLARALNTPTNQNSKNEDNTLMSSDTSSLDYTADTDPRCKRPPPSQQQTKSSNTFQPSSSCEWRHTDVPQSNRDLYGTRLMPSSVVEEYNGSTAVRGVAGTDRGMQEEEMGGGGSLSYSGFGNVDSVLNNGGCGGGKKKETVIEAVNDELTEYVVTRWYRSPEIMLYPHHYEKPVDIWSVGCIFAELVGRKALFAGRDHLDQLAQIVQVLGNPTGDDLDWMPSSVHYLAARKYLDKLPDTPGEAFEDMFPSLSKEGMDLMYKMLKFNPKERISVEEALRHEYFEGLHVPEDEPRCPRTVDWRFDNFTPTKRNLQNKLYEEMADFHPEIIDRDIRDLHKIRAKTQLSHSKDNLQNSCLLNSKDKRTYRYVPPTVVPTCFSESRTTLRNQKQVAAAAAAAAAAASSTVNSSSTCCSSTSSSSTVRTTTTTVRDTAMKTTTTSVRDTMTSCVSSFAVCNSRNVTAGKGPMSGQTCAGDDNGSRRQGESNKTMIATDGKQTESDRTGTRIVTYQQLSQQKQHQQQLSDTTPPANTDTKGQGTSSSSTAACRISSSVTSKRPAGASLSSKTSSRLHQHNINTSDNTKGITCTANPTTSSAIPTSSLSMCGPSQIRGVMTRAASAAAAAAAAAADRIGVNPTGSVSRKTVQSTDGKLSGGGSTNKSSHHGSSLERNSCGGEAGKSHDHALPQTQLTAAASSALVSLLSSSLRPAGRKSTRISAQTNNQASCTNTSFSSTLNSIQQTSPPHESFETGSILTPVAPASSGSVQRGKSSSQAISSTISAEDTEMTTTDPSQPTASPQRSQRHHNRLHNHNQHKRIVVTSYHHQQQQMLAQSNTSSIARDTASSPNALTHCHNSSSSASTIEQAFLFASSQSSQPAAVAATCSQDDEILHHIMAQRATAAGTADMRTSHSSTNNSLLMGGGLQQQQHLASEISLPAVERTQQQVLLQGGEKPTETQTYPDLLTVSHHSPHMQSSAFDATMRLDTEPKQSASASSSLILSPSSHLKLFLSHHSSQIQPPTQHHRPPCSSHPFYQPSTSTTSTTSSSPCSSIPTDPASLPTTSSFSSSPSPCSHHLTSDNPHHYLLPPSHPFSDSSCPSTKYHYHHVCCHHQVHPPSYTHYQQFYCPTATESAKPLHPSAPSSPHTHPHHPSHSHDSFSPDSQGGLTQTNQHHMHTQSSSPSCTSCPQQQSFCHSDRVYMDDVSPQQCCDERRISESPWVVIPRSSVHIPQRSAVPSASNLAYSHFHPSHPPPSTSPPPHCCSNHNRYDGQANYQHTDSDVLMHDSASSYGFLHSCPVHSTTTAVHEGRGRADTDMLSESTDPMRMGGLINKEYVRLKSGGSDVMCGGYTQDRVLEGMARNGVVDDSMEGSEWLHGGRRVGVIGGRDEALSGSEKMAFIGGDDNSVGGTYRSR